VRLLDLTLSGPAENLALDEALLEQVDSDRSADEVLRLWESPEPIVIVGRSTRVAQEVRIDACHQQSVPILRRTSGGAAIVAGPGCLMFAVVLSLRLRPELTMIDRAHQFVSDRMTEALRPLVEEIAAEGTSDLAIDGRKVSGNSIRVKRWAILYHGTLLYDFPLETIGRYLQTPPRQPDYRAGRSHNTFVANLPTSAVSLRRRLVETWQADQALDNWPRDRTEELVKTRYSTKEWNEKR